MPAIRKIVWKEFPEGSGGPTLGRLPLYVAQDEGIFAEEGVELEIVYQRSAWKNDGPKVVEDHRQVDSYDRHYTFEEEEPQLFTACEWGQIRRAYDSHRGGKIVARTTSMQRQALVTRPGSPFHHPRSLNHQPIAVRFHTGSHYAALEMLEGFLRRDEIKLVHMAHYDGYLAMLNGEVAVATLMEPWITLAEKLGCLVLMEARELSAEVGTPDLDPDAYAAFNRARTRAIERINVNKGEYIHKYFDKLVISLPQDLRDLLSPEDFNSARFHWVAPEPYPREEFERTYAWMVSWGLIEENASYETLVATQASGEPTVSGY